MYLPFFLNTNAFAINANYKCYPEKGNANLAHAFPDGWILLSVSEDKLVATPDVKSKDGVDLFIDPALVNNNDQRKKGLIGKFALLGQGFSYDWNLCYNANAAK